MHLDPNRFREVDPGTRVLMGPGPSDVSARVLQAMSAPCIGHLDPYFLNIMDETQQLLRFLFQTDNELTIPVSGTGSAGMETCFVNLVEPGDEVVVCVNGVFGQRMSDIVGRCRGKLTTVEVDWGQIVPPEKVKASLTQGRPRIVAIVHAETSTGVLQPLKEIGQMVKERHLPAPFHLHIADDQGECRGPGSRQQGQATAPAEPEHQDQRCQTADGCQEAEPSQGRPATHIGKQVGNAGTSCPVPDPAPRNRSRDNQARRRPEPGRRIRQGPTSEPTPAGAARLGF